MEGFIIETGDGYRFIALHAVSSVKATRNGYEVWYGMGGLIGSQRADRNELEVRDYSEYLDRIGGR